MWHFWKFITHIEPYGDMKAGVVEHPQVQAVVDVPEVKASVVLADVSASVTDVVIQAEVSEDEVLGNV